MSQGLIKAGLDALYFSNAHTLMSPLCQGIGAIFMLHRVRPAREGGFQPNRFLEVTPEFLEQAILAARENGYQTVSVDEGNRRLCEPGNDLPFVCFTLDDGYRDNLEYAYPVLKKHNVPFTIYIPTAFPDGRGELWWIALEEVIAAQQHVEIEIDGKALAYDVADDRQMNHAYSEIFWHLRGVDESEQRRAVREMCERYGLDMVKLCRETIMNWKEIKQLAADPLATIGAHTVGHYAVAKLDAKTALSEMTKSADMIERKLGKRPRHFCYPYGDETAAGPRDFDLARQAGYKTAVTTRKGLVYPEHCEHMTALPRVSLNGEFQVPRYLHVLLSGVPFMLFNGLQRLNVR